MKTFSLIQKLILCLIAGLLCGQTLLRASDLVLGKVLPPSALIILIIPAVSTAIGSIIYLGIWHWRDMKGIADNTRIKTFWVEAIRYTIAFDLVLFGLQKIFHLQFIAPMGMLDEPFSSISNRWLTWMYFGRSYSFGVTIGLLQILGSLLLVFNRTRLLGVIVLMPIMMNIVLIDYFYELENGVLFHAVIVTAGLLYLLMLDYKRLVEFFFKHTATDSSFEPKYTFMKHIGKLLAVLIPILLIALKESPDKNPEITGKYRVKEMSINGEHKLATSLCDSLLTVVYFDIANDCVFEFNGVSRRMYGPYSLDPDRGTFQTQWYYPPSAKEKTFTGVLKKDKNGEVDLIGLIQSDSVRVKLTRSPS